jgi:hypothetical protein
MVTAVLAVGGTVKYSLLPGAPHNLPPSFQEQPVIDWYLQHSRSLEPPAADPRDDLHVDVSGFSPSSIISIPAQLMLRGEPIKLNDLVKPDGATRKAEGAAEGALFQQVEAHGAFVDSSVRLELDPASLTVTPWLTPPASLQATLQGSPNAIERGARTVVRFYFHGTTAAAVAHLRQGRYDGHLSDTVWITPLASRRSDPEGDFYELWCDIVPGRK